jgi:integrase
MRKGEANALLVSDFHDCKHPYLSITKSVSLKLRRETGKPWLITMPKNNSSVRDIPIPDALASLIREHIEERLKRIEGYNESFFLFGGIRPIPDTTLEMEKQISEKNSGVKHIRIHDLRHSYASMLINSNVPITVISRLLGHTSIEMTWKVYSHLYPTTSNEAIDVINSQLKKTFYTNFTPEN